MLPTEHLLLLRGLAAGDRNGGPIRLAMLLYDQICRGEVHPDDIFAAYYRWICSGGFDMGPTLRSVCSYVAKDYGVSAAVQQTHRDFSGQTAGVGPAHRAAPFALFFRHDMDLMDNLVRQEARLSHFAPLAADVSVITVRLCAHLLDGAGLQSAIDLSLRSMEHISLEPVPMGRRYNGGYAPKVLQVALTFLLETTSFREALENSLVFAGHANYCPVLVGVIGACHYGDVPLDLLQHAQCPLSLQ